MTSYVDTILIDCNRKGSEEYKIKKGYNQPAIFTCKQGAGVKLNPGDEVSVHSAYINERGNEDNMEFSGTIPKDNQTYELEYTEIIHSRLTTETEAVSRKTMMSRNPAWDGPDMREGYGRADCLYYQEDGKGVQQTTSFLRKKTFDVIDNEVNFSISYYKTMNGEGYLSLPRRFDAPNPMRPDNDGYGYGGSAQHDYSNRTDVGAPNDVPDWNGGPTYPVWRGTAKAGTTGMPIDKDYWYYLYTAYDGNARLLRTNDWAEASGAGPNVYPVAGQRGTSWARMDTTTCPSDFENGDVVRYRDRFINAQGPNPLAKHQVLTTGQGVGPDCYFTGRCRPILTPERLVKEDWVFYPHFKFSPTNNDNTNPYPKDPANPQNVQITKYNQMLMGEVGVGYKHTQDNARMTIYIKQTTFWTKNANNITKDRAIHLTGNETTKTEIEAKNSVDDLFHKDGGGSIDPAVNTEWVRYKEIKNVKLDTGYNTPDDVAEQFTDQLNKTQVSEPVKAELLDNATEAQEISVKQSSECYKPFHSATHHSFGENCDTIVNDFSGTTNTITDQAMIDWQTAYHFIGVKRPDLWDAGRAIYYDQICYPGTGTGMASARTFPTIHPNHPITSLGAQNGSRIVTNIPWTRENVMKYKKLFDTQAQYPELFDFDHCIDPGDGTTKQELSVNNARFLHLDIEQSGSGKLGSDNYENADATTPTPQTPKNFTSIPFFFDYHPEFEHLEYIDDFPENSIACYGIFTRVPDGGNHYIAFNAYNIKPSHTLFSVNNVINSGNCFGWDLHFSAYGTKCIMLHTGNLNALYDGKTLLMEKDNNEIETDQKYVNTYPFIRDTYLGANQIEMAVEEKGKFYLHQLHTPEYIGNSFASGSSPDNPINPDASDQVYRVNKRLSGDNYCPDMVPYRPTISTETDTANNGKVEISNFNDNLKPFHIYDAMSGVFIEETGIDLDDWGNSLWGKMGFSYEQFNSSNTFNRQTRLNNLINVENIGAITTNADITAGDVPTYPRNAYGGEFYNSALPNINFPFFEATTEEYGNLVKPSVPAITEQQNSVKIMADGLPVKMNTPYLLIKSDIVQDTKYYGMGADDSQNYTSGQCLPIVGVVNKENGFGDYYFQTISQMAFTITKPTTLSHITTSIHNPDMSLARLENDSAVIYKVKKNNTGNYNIAGELIKKGKLKLNV